MNVTVLGSENEKRLADVCRVPRNGGIASTDCGLGRSATPTMRIDPDGSTIAARSY